MMPPSTVTYAELGSMLSKLDAQLAPREVHALYLGALTSTKLGLGPQKLLDVILGEDIELGASSEDVNKALGVLFGYWNFLVSETELGRVQLAPLEQELTGPPKREDVQGFAAQRSQELTWYARGIDAGGDDPLEFGATGRALLQELAKAGGFFEVYAEKMCEFSDATPAQLRHTWDLLERTSAVCETAIGGLMRKTDEIRAEARATSNAMAGRWTDDGVRVTSPQPRVGRNEPCPCESGKKWKRCCGSPSRLN